MLQRQEILWSIYTGNRETMDEAFRNNKLPTRSIRRNLRIIKKRLRSFFRRSKGMIINVDGNSTCNIIRKAIPELFPDGIEGVGLRSGSLSIRQMITFKGVC